MPSKVKGPNKSADSSLGLLDADAMKNMSAFSDYDVTKENVQPATDISLGQYLQPGGEERLAQRGVSFLQSFQLSQLGQLVRPVLPSSSLPWLGQSFRLLPPSLPLGR